MEMPPLRKALKGRDPSNYVPVRISSLRAFSMTEDMKGENDCLAEIGHFQDSEDKLSVNIDHERIAYESAPGEYLEGVKIYVDINGYPDRGAICIEQDPELGVVMWVEIDLPDGRTISQKTRPFEITKSLAERI